MLSTTCLFSAFSTTCLSSLTSPSRFSRVLTDFLHPTAIDTHRGSSIASKLSPCGPHQIPNQVWFAQLHLPRQNPHATFIFFFFILLPIPLASLFSVWYAPQLCTTPSSPEATADDEDDNDRDGELLPLHEYASCVPPCHVDCVESGIGIWRWGGPLIRNGSSSK
jgi:hypothetical protein